MFSFNKKVSKETFLVAANLLTVSQWEWGGPCCPHRSLPTVWTEGRTLGLAEEELGQGQMLQAGVR